MPTRAEQIERDINASRSHMSRTAEAIERRLSPDGLLDGAISWLRSSPKGRALLNDVTDTVTRNPLPFVVLGIGLGWLAWEVSKASRQGRAGQRSMRQGAGQGVDPDRILGRHGNPRSAREAAEAFRDMDRGGRSGMAAAGGAGLDAGAVGSQGATSAAAMGPAGAGAGGHTTVTSSAAATTFGPVPTGGPGSAEFSDRH